MDATTAATTTPIGQAWDRIAEAQRRRSALAPRTATFAARLAAARRRAGVARPTCPVATIGSAR